MASISNPRKRKVNFTGSEIEALLNEIERRKELVKGELGGIYKTPSDQRKAWEEIISIINSVSCVERQWKEIKDKWLDLKSRYKKAICIFKNNQKTGGVPPELSLTPLEETVVALCGQSSIYGFPTYIDSSSPVPVCNNTDIQENVLLEITNSSSSNREIISDDSVQTISRSSSNEPQKQKKKDKNFEELKLQQKKLLNGLKEIKEHLQQLIELKKEQLKIHREIRNRKRKTNT